MLNSRALYPNLGCDIPNYDFNTMRLINNIDYSQYNTIDLSFKDKVYHVDYKSDKNSSNNLPITITESYNNISDCFTNTSNYDNITAINIISIDFNKISKINENHIVQFIKNKHSLTSLSIKFSNISDEILENIFEYAPNLTKLQLINLTELNNISLIRISHKLKMLKHFNISKCLRITADGLRSIICGLPGLVQLYISKLDNLGESIPELTKLHKLEKLKLSNSILDNNNFISFTNLINLTDLIVSGTTMLSFDDVDHFLALRQSKLHTIGFANCTNLNDEFILDKSKQFPNLTFIDVAGNKCIAGKCFNVHKVK